MCDIANNAVLISGHSQELKMLVEDQVCEPQPQIYSVKAVTVPKAPMVIFSPVSPTDHFHPRKTRLDIMEWFDSFHPSNNLNRGRLSATARSLTFGAQTGRGSERSCIIKRTHDYQCFSLIRIVHDMAQHANPAPPHLGFQILKLEKGQQLNQHIDYHNHPDYPNHTMKFGKYQGGSLQMLRDGKWFVRQGKSVAII